MSDLFVGLMSGTSLDAIDAVVARITDARTELVAARAFPIDEDTRSAIRALGAPGHDELTRTCVLDQQLADAFAAAVNALLRDAGLDRGSVRAIGSHGQTIRHAPDHSPPFTLQIGDPNRIAELTGITTVADFRRRDIAAGGQGAPLVPAFHRAMFANGTESRVVLNIGGIANITVLPTEPAESVAGFDTGPGNTLLDGWAKIHLGSACDMNGSWAGGAAVDENLLERMLGDPYFSRPPPKSTGTEYFSADWLRRLLDDEHPQVVQATLAELTATTIADAIARFAPATAHVLVCGGGMHNSDLIDRLRRLTGAPVESTEACGIDPDWVEALAFAWLARQTLECRPGNLPSVTGARKPVILGAIHPA